MRSPFYKAGFPEIKPENKGKFTAWAKKNGFKDNYSEEVVKMANYANNFGCKNK